MKKIPLIIRHFYSKIIIIIGFGIFFFEDFSRLLDFFKNIIGLNRNALIDDALKVSFLNNLYLIIIAILLCLPILDGIKAFYKANYWDKVCGDKLKSQNIANILFDTAVLEGYVAAIKRAQNIVGITANEVMNEELLTKLNAL